MRSIRSYSRHLSVVLLVVLVAGHVSAEGTNVSMKAVQLLQTAAVFKMKACVNFEQTVGYISVNEEVPAQIKAIGQTVLPGLDANQAWTMLLSHSMCAIAAIDSDEPVAIFYNPWCDIVIATVWSESEGSFRLRDLDVFSGYTVRERSEKELQLTPYWLRANKFAALGIGMAVSKTIAAAEEVFGTAAGARFRDRVRNSLHIKDIGETQHPFACVLVAAHVEVRRMLEAEVGAADGLFVQTGPLTSKFLDEAQKGLIADWLKSADQTIPAISELLMKTPAEWFGLLERVSFVNGKGVQCVVLSPVVDASVAIVLLYDTSGKTAKLRRIDVVDYAGACRAFRVSQATEGKEQVTE